MTEAELVNGCLKADKNCQHTLYTTYSRKMYGVCLRYMQDEHNAADTLQQSFIIVFDQLKNFGFRGSLEGWIRKITIRTCLKQLKKLKNNALRFPPLDSVDHTAGYLDEDKLSHQDILNLIDLLPQGYKMVFNMYVFDDMSHDEIAAELNITSSTSRTQFFKARNYLQKLFIAKNMIQ